MKSSLLAWAAWMVVVPMSIAENLAAPGFVVPSQDIVIRYPAPFEFRWTSPGQTYDCLGQTRAGYHILTSRDDKVGIGFLPFRDEWGHATAESSTYDLQLPENTIVTKAPARLSPGSLILKKGTPYPATAAGDDEYNVAFVFKSFAATVTVHRAQLLPPDPKEVEAATKTEPAAQAPAGGDAAEPEPAPEIAAVPPPATAPEPEKRAEPLAAVEPEPAPAPPPPPIAQAKPAAAPEAALPEIKPAPAVEKPVEEKPAAAPVAAAPAAEVGPIVKHIAVGANVQASSTHTGLEGEGTAAALVDGDLRTRWSSEYAEPQNVVVDLGKPQKLATLRLHWETASATLYSVSFSLDGKKWSPVCDRDLKPPDQPKPWVDDIDLQNITARQIRLDLRRRVNSWWGFSLYEIELIAAE